VSDEILKALERVERNLGEKIDGVGERVQVLTELVAQFMDSFKGHRDWATRNVLRIAEAADVDMAEDPPPKIVAR
jgi:hypothetical protein